MIVLCVYFSLKNFRLNKEGFTLIEVMMGFVIIGIGLLVVMGMQITSIKANSFGYEMTAASTEAQNIVEQIMGMDYNDCQIWDTSGVFVDINDWCINPNNGCPFTGCSEIEFLMNGSVGSINFARIEFMVDDSIPQPGSRTITIFISWIDKIRKDRQVSMITTKSM